MLEWLEPYGDGCILMLICSVGLGLTANNIVF